MLPALSALILSVSSQAIDTLQPESHLALNQKQCGGGNWAAKQGYVFIDARLRRAHLPETTQSSYDNKKWTSQCRMGKDCGRSDTKSPKYPETYEHEIVIRGQSTDTDKPTINAVEANELDRTILITLQTDGRNSALRPELAHSSVHSSHVISRAERSTTVPSDEIDGTHAFGDHSHLRWLHSSSWNAEKQLRRRDMAGVSATLTGPFSFSGARYGAKKMKNVPPEGFAIQNSFSTESPAVTASASSRASMTPNRRPDINLTGVATLESQPLLDNPNTPVQSPKSQRNPDDHGPDSTRPHVSTRNPSKSVDKTKSRTQFETNTSIGNQFKLPGTSNKRHKSRWDQRVNFPTHLPVHNPPFNVPQSSRPNQRAPPVQKPGRDTTSKKSSMPKHDDIFDLPDIIDLPAL